MTEFETISNNSISNATSNIIEDIEIIFGLDIIDCVIFLLYMISSVCLGLYLGRKYPTAEDYFLAGRSMSWPIVGLSLFATNVSSSSLVGLAGTAYSSGISVYNYIWTSVFNLIIFSTFFLPTILQSKIYTLPEMLEIRYSIFARYYFSVLTIILNIFGSTAGGLYSGALVVKMIFPQLEIWHSVAVLAVVGGIYTISGGLVSVMYTDALQAVTLIVGSILVCIFAFIEVGGWGVVREEVPADYLSLIRPVDDDFVPWTGIIFAMPILGFYYWSTNQSVVQRMLSSKDSNHGRWGTLFGSLCILPLLLYAVLPGTIARIIFPTLPNPDLVYPKLMFTLLPVGVLGVAFSGFIAALLSGVDTNLNSASTLITMDFIKKFKPDLKPKQLMNIGKLVTFIVMIISVCWTPFIGNFGSLYQYLQKLLSYLTPPVVALYVVGFFWKGANARGASVTIILGSIWGIAFFVINEVLDLINMQFLHVAPILFTFSVIILIGVSLTSGKPCSEEQFEIMWSYKNFKDDVVALKKRPLWQNYHIHSLLLIIICIIIIGFFW